VDMAARMGLPLAARFAALLHDLGKGTTPADLLPRHHGHERRGEGLVRAVCARLKVPAECRDLAVLVAREHGIVHRAEELRPETVLRLLERCDALRRPERFDLMLAACEADYHGRTGFEARAYPQARYLQGCLKAALDVDSGALARQAASPAAIPEIIRAARCQAIKQMVRTGP